MKKLVSIITPSYNSIDFIRETIQSIINQTYENWELLITDDCSTDGTWEILQEYSNNHEKIKIFRLESNLGAGVARNYSISKAKGDFIAFCDSDDVWADNKLERQIDFLKSNKLIFTCSAYQKMDEDGNYMGIFYPPENITFNDLLKTCSIGCLTAIYDCDKIGKIYMPNIRKRQDYGLWLKIFRKINKTKSMSNQVLAYYRIRSGSVSRNKIQAALYHYKVLRKYGKVGFIKSVYYFITYFIHGFIKFLK